MTEKFLQTVVKRRSIYELSNHLPIEEKVLIRLLEEGLKHAPSSFNAQSTRLVILLKDAHHKLWELTKAELQKIVPPAKFKPTAQKLAAFSRAYGTILYFEDMEVVRGLQKDFPLYKDNFPLWSEQGNAMVQYLIWCLLADYNIGANLQHYNPLIDNAVKMQWNLPADWRLIAQMPFGSIQAPAEEKPFLPLKDRIKVFS